MLDRAFRTLVRNYWSVFFLVAAITVPVQIAYATIWRHVIAVSELHPAIEGFPPLRQVRGVGVAQLDEARLAHWIVWAVEIALIPLFLRATQRVLAAESSGDAPTARDAWRGAFAGGQGIGAARTLARPGLLLVGAAAAALVYGALVTFAGMVTELLPPGQRFAWVGLAGGAARAAAAPFFLVVAAGGAWSGHVRGRPAPQE